MVTEQSTQLNRDDVVVHTHNAPGAWRGTAWHVEIADHHYVVSAVDLPAIASDYKTCETAVFPAREDGSVENYGDLVMLNDVKDHEAAIAALLEELNGRAEGAAKAQDGPVEEFLRWLVRMDDPADEQGIRDRQTIRLSTIIDRARDLLGGA